MPEVAMQAAVGEKVSIVILRTGHYSIIPT